ncbi:MAG: hypothetical protein EOP34_09735, partial [Rickettsiales bacterium]
LNLLSDVDLIIEAIVENSDIKKELYKNISKHISDDCIISSNTSTIMLSRLTESLEDNIKNRFLIIHFFNPPRIMRLIEIIKPLNFREDLYKKLCDFLEINLGKIIVISSDTPGFIANRIGCYFMLVGLNEAISLNVNIDRADSLISRYLLTPKTGIFGLFDLIGIDVMELISKSLMSNLDEDDDFTKQYIRNNIVTKMISSKMLGRKTNCGFYKIRERQKLDLKSFTYFDTNVSNIDTSSPNIIDFLESNNVESNYVWNVISKTILYAIDLIPEVTDDIIAIDSAMKLGFGWKLGIFEYIDYIRNQNSNKIEYILNRIQKENKEKLKILDNKNIIFYKNNQKYSFNDHNYIDIDNVQSIDLNNIRDRGRIVYQNSSASVLDIGDDVICFTIDSKSGVLDYPLFEALYEVIYNIIENYRGLIITNQNKIFSAGADLQY